MNTHNTERSWRLFSRWCQHLIDRPDEPIHVSLVRIELEEEGLLGTPDVNAELVRRLEEAATSERSLQQRLEEVSNRNRHGEVPSPVRPTKQRRLVMAIACCLSGLVTIGVFGGGQLLSLVPVSSPAEDDVPASKPFSPNRRNADGSYRKFESVKEAIDDLATFREIKRREFLRSHRGRHSAGR